MSGLEKLGRGPVEATRVYVADVTVVTGNTVTVDPHDGDVVDQVPWVGQTPQIGDQIVLLLSAGQLLGLSMGRPD